MPESCRLIPWTRAFCPSPIRVQEARVGSRTARLMLVREIPDHLNESIPGPHAFRERFGPHRPERGTFTKAAGSRVTQTRVPMKINRARLCQQTAIWIAALCLG